MPANAGGLPDDDEHAARELHALLGDGDAGLGRERLDAWLALGVLPVVPSYVRTTHALWRAASGWTRLAGEVTPALLLGHFRGEWALVFAGESRLVVHDIDNQAGKSGTGGVDADLAARVEVVRRAAPGAVWLRSSGTGGLHAWTFLDESHPLRVLVYLARERVLRAADDVAELVALIRSVHADQGRTIVMVVHDLNHATRHATHARARAYPEEQAQCNPTTICKTPVTRRAFSPATSTSCCRSGWRWNHGCAAA